jgi:hypothetical protein
MAALLDAATELCLDLRQVNAQLTDHHNYFGNSQDGELGYHEVGANVAFEILPNLTASAGVFLRDAGTADELYIETQGNTDRELDEQEERLLVDLEGIPSDLEITGVWNVMLGDTFGKWRVVFTHSAIDVRLETPVEVDIGGDFEVTLDVVSLGWEGDL